MSKELAHCPICGSTKTERFENETSEYLTLGNKFSFKEIYYSCNSCQEECDIFAETDVNYINAQKNAQIDFVKEVLENMHRFGITMAMFERVFELPPRTLTRWKSGDFSSNVIALLRILITYPWILEVAEHKFEKNYAKYAVVSAAANEFKNETVVFNTTISPRSPETASGGNNIIPFDTTKIKSGKSATKSYGG